MNMKFSQPAWISIFITLVAVMSGYSQREKSTLLPASEAKAVTSQCSRPGPNQFTDTWTPLKEDISKMERRLSEIKKLVALDCCSEGGHIENPEKYYMQYVAIVLKGKRLIYISAFADSDPRDFWKDKAYVICDGGTAWGVLYDPITGQFFDLAINGVA